MNPIRRRAATLLAALLAANFAAWGWAFAAFHGSTVLLGTAFLAYGFGLRHAVDADHIAAIDNVTRKLMRDAGRPTAVGFFFALGHSSIVIVVATAIAVSGMSLEQRLPTLAEAGATFGTLVSAGFLLAIAAVNAVVLVNVARTLRAVRHGAGRATPVEALAPRGVLAWALRHLLRLISRSWQMYWVGLLFGLGFDTASEIGLLGIAGAEAARGLPLLSILVFPALFTAGMSLIDTADGMLMLGVYGWALSDPMRKLYYNLGITAVSVVVAVMVGGFETLGLISDKLGASGGVWNAVNAVGDHFAALGYIIIGVFVASWLLAMLVYRLRGQARLGA